MPMKVTFELSDRDLRQLRELVKEASQRAKERRKVEIKAIEKLITGISDSLAVPGLSESTRKTLRNLRRRRRSQLLRLKSKEAMDFGGMLTPAQNKEIKDVLKRAKQDVARKKQATAFLGTLMRVADMALTIAAT